MTAGPFDAEEAPRQQSSPLHYGTLTGQALQQSNGLKGIQQPTGTGFRQGQPAAQQFAQPTWTGRQPSVPSQQTVPATQAPLTGQRGVPSRQGLASTVPEFGYQQPIRSQGTQPVGATAGGQFASAEQFGQEGATGVAGMTAKSAGSTQVAQQVEGEGQVQTQLASEQPEPATSLYVDVFDKPDEILVVADLPGFGHEDVDLQLSNSSLRITGERESESEDEESHAIQRERLPRAERVVQLPTNVEGDEAEASCENGVVRIHLPKAEAEREQHIDIQ